MASLGRFNYYTSQAPATDAAFGYPILQAPPNKALKIIQLAAFNITNTANTELALCILPASGASQLADGSYSLLTNQIFVVGVANAALTGSNVATPITFAGVATKGFYTEIIVPPGAKLLGFAPSINLNGTIEYRATAYECDVDGY